MDSEDGKEPGDGFWMSFIGLCALIVGAGFASLWLNKSEDNLLLTWGLGSCLTVFGIGPLFMIKGPLKYFLLFVGCFGLGLLIRSGMALA